MVAGFFAADRSPEFKTRRQPIKKTLAAFEIMCNPPNMFFCGLQHIES
jgi:hypothetical protein